MRAALYMATAMICFTGMSAIVRLASHELPALQVVFFRNLFALPFFLVMALGQGAQALKTRNFGLQCLRAVNGAMAMAATFTAYTLIPLTEATSLGFASPLFATLAAVLILGERIRFHRTAALIIGAIGVLIILQPGAQPVSLGAGLALFGALNIGVAAVLVRRLTQYDSPVAIGFWMVALQTPISLVGALYVWQTPSWEAIGLCVGLAALGTLGHVIWARASSLAEVTQLQPFEFLKLPFAALFGFALFAEGVELPSLIGGVVIFAGAAWATHREAALARKNRRAVVTPASGAISGEVHHRPPPER